MPTYEYACRACGAHLEVVQSFKDPSLTECPACGGVLRKVFSPVGVVLKGSGFYRNDSRPTAKSESGEGAKGDGAKGEGAAAKGGESGAKGDGKAKAGKGEGSGTGSKSSSGESKAAGSGAG